MKKIITLGTVALMILSMVGCSSTDEYYTENGNAYKKPVEEVVEPKEESIDEDKLSSLPPLQRLFFEIDKDDNWHDIEEKMNKYPELIPVHRRAVVDSKGNRRIDTWLEIGYEKDLATREIEVEFGKMKKIEEEEYIDGELISMDFLKGVDNDVCIIDLLYHNDNFTIYYENDIFTVKYKGSIDEEEYTKSELIDYLYNKED